MAMNVKTENNGQELRHSSLDTQYPAGFKVFVAISLVLHIGFGAAAVISSLKSEAKPIVHEKPIVAKLVRLGEKKPPQQLPRNPVAPAPPEQTVNLKPPKEDAKIKEPTPKEKQPKRDSSADRKSAMLEALAKMERQYKQSGRPEIPEGDPQGDPYGTAAEGREGDRYLMLIDRKVREYWSIPTIISEKERLYLRATVVIYLDSTGKLLKVEMEKSSGNNFFDNSLLSAIQQSNPFPPPPPAFAKRYQETGIGINFRSSQ